MKKDYYARIGRCAVVRGEFSTKFSVDLVSKAGGRGVHLSSFDIEHDAVSYAQKITANIDRKNANTGEESCKFN